MKKSNDLAMAAMKKWRDELGPEWWLLWVLVTAIGRVNGEGWFETEQIREAKRQAGRLTHTAKVFPDADPKLLQVMARSGGEMVNRVSARAGLTNREDEILRHLMAGLSAKQIRDAVSPRWRNREGLSIATVERHIANIRAKLRGVFEGEFGGILPE